MSKIEIESQEKTLIKQKNTTINMLKEKFIGRNILEKIEFSKNNTLALKGIAIIMMMFHHCFLAAKRFKGYDVSFFPLNQGTVIEISLFFKICVSIFAFITGYGLMLSISKLLEKKETTGKEVGKWTIGRLIKTLSGYWIIVVLSLIICQLINGRTGSVLFKDGIVSGIVNVIMNLFGLCDLFGVKNLNSTWWYMSLAVLFIISIPIFAKMFKKYGYFVTLALVIALPRIIGWKFSVNTYISFLFPVLLGMICAEQNLLVKFANFKIIKKNKIADKVLKFIIETAIFVLLYMLYNNLKVDRFYEIMNGVIPMYIIMYFYEFYLDIPILKNILGFLGKHSMNIFLIHTFIRATYLENFIYSRGNFIVIAAVLLGLSLAISIILEFFKKLIRYDNLINKLIEVINRVIDDRSINKIKLSEK